MKKEEGHSSTLPTHPTSTLLEQLSSRHEAIIHRLVIDGVTPREISREFGLSESRLSILRSSPLWKEAERRLRESLRSERIDTAVRNLEGLLPKAVGALKDCVSAENDPRVRLMSAKEILDRVGIGSQSQDRGAFSQQINLYIPAHFSQKKDKDEAE